MQSLQCLQEEKLFSPTENQQIIYKLCFDSLVSSCWYPENFSIQFQRQADSSDQCCDETGCIIYLPSEYARNNVEWVFEIKVNFILNDGFIMKRHKIRTFNLKKILFCILFSLVVIIYIYIYIIIIVFVVFLLLNNKYSNLFPLNES